MSSAQMLGVASRVGVDLRARTARVSCTVAAATLALTLFALPPAAHASCTPTHAVNAHLTLSGSALTVDSAAWNYANCSVPDLDQRRAPDAAGLGGLPLNGHDFCVPTSAMDWMVWLSEWGFASHPGNVDWTRPRFFNAMTGDINTMGINMSTDPAAGTDANGLITGVADWLQTFGTRPSPLVSKVFFFITGEQAPDLPLMMINASLGALVMVNIGWTNTDGSFGGHELALQAGAGTLNDSTVTLDLMDPNSPVEDDHVQQPYTRDPFVFKADSSGAWNLVSSPAGYPSDTHLVGYSMIIPAEVLSSDAPSMIIDNPEPLIESRVHPRTVTRVRLPERGRVLDLAVSPAGLENPYLTAGSNTIWALNALDHSSVKFAAGPVGANHLTYGGADQTLFVSGAKQLMAFAPGGARIGTVSLSTSLDGLAYDARSDRLVGLSIARRRLLFFSPTLTSEGSAPVPASLLPRGRPASLAVSSDGTVFVHAAGRNTIAVATPAANSRLRFGTVKLQGLTRPSFGLAAEDNGNLLVVVRHRLVEFQRTGARALRSHYTGMPADGIIRVDHSFSTIPTTATQQFAMQ